MTFSLRNFLGAALGGVLGILAWGFVDPWTCVLGCLLGVLLGYHYEFIGARIGGLFDSGIKFDIGGTLHQAMSRLGSVLRPTHLTKMRLMRVVTLLIFAAGFAVQVFLGNLLFDRTSNHWLLAAILVWLVVTIIASGLSIAQTAQKRWDEGWQPGSFEEWVLWNKTPKEYLVSCTLDMFHLSVAWWYLVGVGLAWLSTAGLLFFVVVLFPILVVWFIGQMLCEAVMRGGHWFSFAMCMTATVVTGWCFNAHFGDPRIVWLVALGNGIISGIVAEVLRLTMVWMITYVPFAKNWPYASLQDATRSAFAFFGKVTRKLVADFMFNEKRTNWLAPRWVHAI